MKKVAIVTGGAQGIGKAISLKLCEERWTVIIGDKDAGAGDEMVAAYQKIFDVHFMPTDVSDEEAVRRLFEFAEQTCGRLDALVNNAGIAQAHNSPLQRLSLEEWNSKISTNLTGMFLCAKYGAPLLGKAGGNIVNIASTRAQMSEPDTEAYSASKGGIVALTHALANSLGPSVRVNCISPGWIATEAWQKQSEREKPDLRAVDHRQHPAGRVGKPDDIAHLAYFLLSDRADFITGQNINVDGGMSTKMIYEE